MMRSRLILLHTIASAFLITISLPLARAQTPTTRPASVIYVCDASGSMLSKIKAAKEEIAKGIHELRQSQKFNVIFFSGPDDPVCAFSADAPITATVEHKQSLNEFLAAVGAKGETDPIRALIFALKQKPRVLYFLTDGYFERDDAVLEAVRKANSDHITTIYTIAFVNDEDRKHLWDIRARQSLLKRIAQENGGSYKENNTDSDP